MLEAVEEAVVGVEVEEDTLSHVDEAANTGHSDESFELNERVDSLIEETQDELNNPPILLRRSKRSRLPIGNYKDLTKH